MAVRYDKKFLSEIRGIKAAFNRKVARLTKEGKTNVPKRFTSEEFKNIVLISKTRKEIRRRLKDYKTFIKKGGENIVSIGKNNIPKYLLENIKRYQRLLKYQTTVKLKEFETRKPIANGKVQPFTFAQYGSEEYLTTKARRETLLGKDLSQMSIKDLNDYLDKLRANTRPKREEIWQESYIKILEDTALSYGYDPDKLSFIVDKLRTLKPHDFSDLTFINRNIKAIVYYYKLLESIQSNKELTDVGDDVARNLDEIYEYIDEMIAEYD